MSDLNPLYWEYSYEIALALIAQHPNISPETVDSIGIGQLYDWIIALPDFADDPALVNDGILLDILREWYEEIDKHG